MIFKFKVKSSSFATALRHSEASQRREASEDKLKLKVGFTLIEILVVIALIGILAGVLLVSLQGARASARDAQRKSDLETIQSALEMYKSTCGKYPTSLPAGGSALTGCEGVGTQVTFLSSIPKDPIATKSYTYSSSTTETTYTASATMESGQVMQVTPLTTTYFTPTATPIPTATATPTNTPIPTATPTPCGAPGVSCDNDSQCCSNYCIGGKKCK